VNINARIFSIIGGKARVCSTIREVLSVPRFAEMRDKEIEAVVDPIP
jgi:hypothetical protein